MNLLNCLEYPLDVETILRKKKAIKKVLQKEKNCITKNIAILGGSTTAEIKNILELFLLKQGIKANFYESDYNKFYEDALFGNEVLAAFKPDIIYIHTSHVNIAQFPEIDDSEETVNALLNAEHGRYQAIWIALQQYDCAIIQNNFDLPADRSLGNLDCSLISGRTHFISALNSRFSVDAREISNLYINDINYLAAYLGIQQWFDRQLWYIAKYAVSYHAIPSLVFNISNIINAIFGQAKKCLVLDLDNTCWGGVIGDDGLHGIKIGTESVLGEAYSAFQSYVRELKRRGVILAVCSKNEYQTAKQGFSHRDSILTFQDFSAFKANWDSKHQNVTDIAKEINIGVDSLVFIDDNPAEREIVASQVPEVVVPDIGDNMVNYIDYIDKAGYFEVVTLSADDKARSHYYSANKNRLAEQAIFTDYKAFLKSLRMVAEIKSFSDFYLERITQLVNKTNQFNLTTRRYTLGEINEIAVNSTYVKLYGRLSDKYGDNGLITVMIAAVQDQQCHIELWLMSCRVLKRDMELAMLDQLVQHCRSRGLQEIIGYFKKTKKNNMVSQIYKRLGFDLLEEQNENSVWSLSLTNYKNLNKTIKVEND